MFVRHIIAALLCIEINICVSCRGSKYLDIIVCAAVDPDVVIELQVRDVVDVMDACVC